MDNNQLESTWAYKLYCEAISVASPPLEKIFCNHLYCAAQEMTNSGSTDNPELQGHLIILNLMLTTQYINTFDPERKIPLKSTTTALGGTVFTFSPMSLAEKITETNPELGRTAKKALTVYKQRMDSKNITRANTRPQKTDEKTLILFLQKEKEAVLRENTLTITDEDLARLYEGPDHPYINRLS